MSLQLWDDFWKDSDKMMSDVWGKEIVRQMTRSVYSISANMKKDTEEVLARNIHSFSGIPEDRPGK